VLQIGNVVRSRERLRRMLFSWLYEVDLHELVNDLVEV
jgi:hypothetical protein